MRTFLSRFSILGLVLLVWVSVVCAQQEQPAQQPSSAETAVQEPGSPDAAAPSSPLPQGQAAGQQPTSQQGQTGPPIANGPSLTGAEEYTLGHMGAGHSYLSTSFQFAQSVATSGTGAFGASTVDPVSTLSGLLSVHHLWSRYDLSAQYAGTALLYDQQSALNTSAHEFSLSQRVQGRRSSFLLNDVVTYMPEASFGYARFSGYNGLNSVNYGYAGLYGASGDNLNTNFLPNQSILTGPSSRVSNAVVGEYDYLTSPLSSLTVTGSYALLRFPSSGYINSDDAIVTVGYDHTFTPKDSVALSYQGGIFRFSQYNNDFTTNAVSLTYRRAVSHRLGVQVGAGPQINVFSNSTTTNQTSWQASGMLTYGFRRTSLDLNYLHYTNGGSGVFVGARTDEIEASITLPLSQMWSVNTDMAYALNRTIQGGNLAGAGSSYKSWYGTINFTRALNRSLTMFVGYNLQQQLAGSPTCVGSTCGTFYTAQYFSFGFSWRPALVGIE